MQSALELFVRGFINLLLNLGTFHLVLVTKLQRLHDLSLKEFAVIHVLHQLFVKDSLRIFPVLS